ncbi:hypothetical protein TRVA0_001S00474 [Trichomonascus vanleenenianus]|uniref:cytochrome P450 n=1 Tax=Trichomonascus vanleenenianus TaxID=2268995 RepID=UPI003ECBACB5
MLVLWILLSYPVAYLLYELWSEFNFRRLQVKHGCQPPVFESSVPYGVRAALGYFWAYRNNRLNPYFQSQFEKHGSKTFRVQSISRTLLTTYDPENIKAILAKNFKDFDLGTRHSQFQPLMGDGIFTLSGDAWKHSRDLLRPQFSQDQVSRLGMLEEHFKDLVAAIDSYQSRFLDIQDLFFRLTLDTATEFLFGESTDSLSEGKRIGYDRYAAAEQFAQAFRTGQEILVRRTMAEDLHPFIGGKEYERVTKVVHDFIDYYVEKALADKSPPDRYIMLREITKQTQDPRSMRDQALNVLLAGRDTTAASLSFVVALLVRHKDTWTALRQEVLATFGTTPDHISFASLKRCRLLQNVIKEALRVHPVVPINSRQAVNDTILPRGGGPHGTRPIFIPKGTVAQYHTYSLHRCKEYWGDSADEFDPSRWDTLSAAQIAWKYIPFNGGPRICLGQQFALTEAGYTIARLAQTYSDITTTEHDASLPIVEKSTLTSSVYGGVWVKLSKPLQNT